MSAAFWPVATRPMAALPRRAGIIVITAVGAAAGVGAAFGVLNATVRSVGAVTGVGATPIGVLRATSIAAGNAAGGSSAGASDSPASIAYAAGTSLALGVAYAFISDSERACLHQEIRTVSVTLEDRIAIAPAEDRVYRVAADRTVAGNQPRKRIC